MSQRYLFEYPGTRQTVGMRLPQSSSTSSSIPRVFIFIVMAFVATLSLHDQAAAQQLQCFPAAMRFGTVAIGQNETQLVILTNTGTTAVTVSSISESVSGFTVSGANLPLTLAAGQSTGLNATFAPTVVGWVGGKVTFTSNAPDTELKMGIEGTGGQRVALTAAPSTVSFGQISVGSQSTLPLMLTNTATWNVTVKSFQALGTGFSLRAPSVPYVINAGQSVTLNVTFAPQAAGLTGGSVQVLGPNLIVPLTGTGTTAGILTITPTALNFGNVDVGSSATLSSTLSATAGSVTISSASTNNSQFAIAGVSFPLTIGAGQNVPFSVVFSPSVTGAVSGTLTFISNASDGKATESLAGVGIAPTYSVALSWTPSNSPVVGYNVYRGLQVGVYSKINTSLDPGTTYTDNSVVDGATYYYAATAVNSNGQESSYSSPIEVVIP